MDARRKPVQGGTLFGGFLADILGAGAGRPELNQFGLPRIYHAFVVAAGAPSHSDPRIEIIPNRVPTGILPLETYRTSCT